MAGTLSDAHRRTYKVMKQQREVLLPDAMASLDRACQAVTHLYEVTRIATHDTPLGPALDLERSAAPDESTAAAVRTSAFLS